MKATLVIVGLLALLVVTVGWVVWDWQQTADVEMSWHGNAAMVLGIVFTTLIGCGLMALMFYSSRHGFDEAATDLSDKDGHERLP
jgi:predicted Na+-dependent transporter